MLPEQIPINLCNPDLSERDLVEIAVKIWNSLESPSPAINLSYTSIQTQLDRIESNLKDLKKHFKILQAYGKRYGSNKKTNNILVKTTRRLIQYAGNNRQNSQIIVETFPATHVGDLKRWFENQTHSPKSIWDEGIRGVVQDLIILSKELNCVTWYPQDKILSIITEPIVLVDRYDTFYSLGPMKIKLLLGKAKNRSINFQGYYVSPEKPNWCSGSDETYFHPHVSGDQLCEGEGKMAITQCLADVRILDFFSLITSILKTYNPSSPYTKLEHWHGKECIDCGEIKHRDECYVCYECDEIICDDCCRYCESCNNCFCCDHGSSCSNCGETKCSNCLTYCKDCDRTICLEDSCKINCHNCRDIICTGTECSTTCTICNQKFCNNCGDQIKKIGDKFYCLECEEITQ